MILAAHLYSWLVGAVENVEMHQVWVSDAAIGHPPQVLKKMMAMMMMTTMSMVMAMMRMLMTTTIMILIMRMLNTEFGWRKYLMSRPYSVLSQISVRSIEASWNIKGSLLTDLLWEALWDPVVVTTTFNDENEWCSKMDHTDTSLSNKSSLKRLLSDLIKICSPKAGKSAHLWQVGEESPGRCSSALHHNPPSLAPSLAPWAVDHTSVESRDQGTLCPAITIHHNFNHWAIPALQHIH